LGSPPTTPPTHTSYTAGSVEKEEQPICRETAIHFNEIKIPKWEYIRQEEVVQGVKTASTFITKHQTKLITDY
jgi:hypothetical protein